MRWKSVPDEADTTDAKVPDALAVFDIEGALTGWDEAFAHEYLLSRGSFPSGCDDECAAEAHVRRW